MRPEPTTAGTPIPGATESPTRHNPGIGVCGPGNEACPAAMAGPYVPRYRRRNVLCVRGEPILTISRRASKSGMIVLRARNSGSAFSFFLAL